LFIGPHFRIFFDVFPRILPVSTTAVKSTLTWLKETLVESQKGIRDVVILMVPQGVALVTGFVTTILIARGLGPTGLGQYALVMSVAGIAASLSDLGIGQTAIRYASRAVSLADTEEQYAVLRWAFRLRVGLAVAVTALFMLLAPVIAHFWGGNELSPLLRIGLLGGIFTALASVPTVYFQSLKQFQKNATVAVAQTLIVFLGIVAVAWLQWWSVEIVLIATLLGSAVAALMFLLLVPRAALIPRRRITLADLNVRRLLRKAPIREPGSLATQTDSDPMTFAAFNLISTIIVMITLRMDVWIMGYLLDQKQVGIYFSASRFALPLSIVLTAINGALWPRASAHMSLRQIKTLLVQTFRLSTLVAAAGTLYAIVFPLLAPVIFGQAYAAGTTIGQVLSLRYALAILICPVGVIGYSLGMVRVYWWINAIQLAAVVSITVWLLPVIGPLGAALALIANEVIGVLFAGSILWRRIRLVEQEEASV
jgi:O-antigen/teichoic acid export membrane protein